MGLDRIGWNGIYLRGLAIGVTRASCRCKKERRREGANFTGGQECDRNMFCVISCRYYIVFMCARLYVRKQLVRGVISSVQGRRSCWFCMFNTSLPYICRPLICAVQRDKSCCQPPRWRESVQAIYRSISVGLIVDNGVLHCLFHPLTSPHALRPFSASDTPLGPAYGPVAFIIRKVRNSRYRVLTVYGGRDPNQASLARSISPKRVDHAAPSQKGVHPACV